ncbi:MAG TPA: hypothetical protein VLL52_08410 [Anaerolineae bacterium]|nr:hypothetical protein [Anaerolineae bacterium]
MSRKLNRWLRSQQGIATIIGVAVLLVGGFMIINYLNGGDTPTPTAGTVVTFPDETCLPTCDITDGKFLYVPGQGTASLTDASIVVWFMSPASANNFNIQIFDGDSGKDNTGNINKNGGNWDSTTDELVYTLYADPLQDGTGANALATWYGNQDNGGNPMPNNAWWSTTVAQDGSAMAPNKSMYIYRLEVTGNIAAGGSAFKLRTENAGLVVGNSAKSNTSIGLIGRIGTANDFSIIYPNGTNQPSTYNGQWTFTIYVDKPADTLRIWDGDFDFGSRIVTNPDDDDANTVGKPAWANNVAVDERYNDIGDPADNFGHPIIERGDSVKYTIYGPDGTNFGTVVNANPSGTEEWEQFVVSTAAGPEASTADAQVAEIPAGYYTIEISGLDVNNVVWLRIDHNVCQDCPEVTEPQFCPRTIGYWKNNIQKVLIDGRDRGVQETEEDLIRGLEIVANSTLYRTGLDLSNPAMLSNIERLSNAEANEIMQRQYSTSMMSRALQQNLASWMNLATNKVSDNVYVELRLGEGGEVLFEGEVIDALLQAHTIMLEAGAMADPDSHPELEWAKDIADAINNGWAGEDAEGEGCSTDNIPPDQQPPSNPDDLPEEPEVPETPPQVPELPEEMCTMDGFDVENTTNNPFYSIKFNTQGEGVRDGSIATYQFTLNSSDVAAMTEMQLEAKASTSQSTVTLNSCDFTGTASCGPVTTDDGNFVFTFTGSRDNGNGTHTLSFAVQNLLDRGLSHVSFGLPEGVTAICQ